MKNIVTALYEQTLTSKDVAESRATNREDRIQDGQVSSVISGFTSTEAFASGSGGLVMMGALARASQ